MADRDMRRHYSALIVVSAFAGAGFAVLCYALGYAVAHFLGGAG